ncbi:tail fiber assembly protein [Shigella boydii]|uniref:tail fiber assembly protein n=1 Tax=Shigella boydii TaxID=621 RepID=UPI000D8CE3AF|nr:tail fiber assembly protein [Shigella boydii]SPZ60127.1 tail fiber assembly protein [Shigella boydii]
MVKRIYTADEQQQQAESQRSRCFLKLKALFSHWNAAVRLNMAMDEEAHDWSHGNATAFWSAVWIQQIPNGTKA